MNLDRFKNFDPDVRELVLAFEHQQPDKRFFDVSQLEVIADYYLEVSDFEGLEAVVNCGERLFPSNEEICLRKAHLLSARQQYPQALKLLKEMERSDKHNTDISYALGAVYSSLGQPEKSIEYYRRASSDGYGLGMVYANIADEYYKLGDTDEAVRYYRKAIEADPDEERALYNLACAWNEAGRTDESVEFFSHHVTEHPYSKGAWYTLGCVYYWAAQFLQAADAFEYAIAIDKTYFAAYLGLSDSYAGLQQYGRAVQALRESLDYADDRAYIIFSMARVYMNAGNYHTALSYLHEVLKEDPSYALAWNNLGICCLNMNLSDEAAGYFRRAIDLDPGIDEYWLNLADLLIASERYGEACSLLENGRTDAVMPCDFDTRLIYCCFKTGRRNRMLALFRAMAASKPDEFPDLLRRYPELSSDINAMNIIKQY